MNIGSLVSGLMQGGAFVLKALLGTDKPKETKLADHGAENKPVTDGGPFSDRLRRDFRPKGS